MSSVPVRSISTSTPVRLNAVSPDAEAIVMSYLPTGSAPNEYVPWASVVAVNCAPFSALIAVTVASATGAPLSFLTTPRTPPR